MTPKQGLTNGNSDDLLKDLNIGSDKPSGKPNIKNGNADDLLSSLGIAKKKSSSQESSDGGETSQPEATQPGGNTDVPVKDKHDYISNSVFGKSFQDLYGSPTTVKVAGKNMDLTSIPYGPIPGEEIKKKSQDLAKRILERGITDQDAALISTKTGDTVEAVKKSINKPESFDLEKSKSILANDFDVNLATLKSVPGLGTLISKLNPAQLKSNLMDGDGEIVNEYVNARRNELQKKISSIETQMQNAMRPAGGGGGGLHGTGGWDVNFDKKSYDDMAQQKAMLQTELDTVLSAADKVQTSQINKRFDKVAFDQKQAEDIGMKKLQLANPVVYTNLQNKIKAGFQLDQQTKFDLARTGYNMRAQGVAVKFEDAEEKARPLLELRKELFKSLDEQKDKPGETNTTLQRIKEIDGHPDIAAYQQSYNELKGIVDGEPKLSDQYPEVRRQELTRALHQAFSDISDARSKERVSNPANPFTQATGGITNVLGLLLNETPEDEDYKKLASQFGMTVPEVKRLAVGKLASDHFTADQLQKGADFLKMPLDEFSSLSVTDSRFKNPMVNANIARAMGVDPAELQKLEYGMEAIAGYKENALRLDGLLSSVSQGAYKTLQGMRKSYNRYFGNGTDVEIDVQNELIDKTTGEYMRKPDGDSLFGGRTKIDTNKFKADGTPNPTYLREIVNDKANKFNLTPRSFVSTVGDTVGQMSIFAGSASMVGKAAKLVSGLGAESVMGTSLSTIANVSAKGERFGELFGTVASGYAMSYDDHYRAAQQYSNDENVLKQSAGVNAFIEGLSELILPDVDVVKAMRGNKTLFNTFNSIITKNGGTLTKGGLREYAGAVIKTLGVANQEGLEEIIVEPMQAIADKKILNKDINWAEVGENAKQAYVTAVIGMVPNAIGGGMGSTSSLKKQSLFEAGNEPSTYISHAQDLLANKKISQGKANEIIQNVNTMADIVRGIPNTDGNGNPYSVEQKTEFAAQEFRIRKNKQLKESTRIDVVTQQADADTKSAQEIQTQILAQADTTQEIEKPAITDLKETIINNQNQNNGNKQEAGTGTETNAQEGQGEESLLNPESSNAGDEINPDITLTEKKDLLMQAEAAIPSIKNDIYRGAFSADVEGSLREAAQQLNGADEAGRKSAEETYGPVISKIAKELYPNLGAPVAENIIDEDAMDESALLPDLGKPAEQKPVTVKIGSFEKDEMLSMIDNRKDTVSEDPESADGIETEDGALDILRGKVESGNTDYNQGELEWLKSEADDLLQKTEAAISADGNPDAKKRLPGIKKFISQIEKQLSSIEKPSVTTEEKPTPIKFRPELEKLQGAKSNLSPETRAFLGRLNSYPEQYAGFEEVGGIVDFKFYDPQTKTDTRWAVEGDAGKMVDAVEKHLREIEVPVSTETKTPAPAETPSKPKSPNKRASTSEMIAANPNVIIAKPMAEESKNDFALANDTNPLPEATLPFGTDSIQETPVSPELTTAEKKKKAIEDAKAEFLAAFKASRGNLTIGVDPTLLAMGIKLVGAYIDDGIYRFGQMVKEVVDSFGERDQALLNAMKQVYGAALINNDHPEMDDIKTVKAFTYEMLDEDVSNTELSDVEALSSELLGAVQEMKDLGMELGPFQESVAVELDREMYAPGADLVNIRQQIEEILLSYQNEINEHKSKTGSETSSPAGSTEAIISEGRSAKRKAALAKSAKQKSDAIESIDEAIIKINEKLQLLGEYAMKPGDFHETPSVLVAKEYKKDLARFSKELAKAMGYEHDTDKKGKPIYADTNIAPIGGDGTIILWKPGSQYGVYISIPIESENYENYNTKNTFYWRVTSKEKKYSGFGNQWGDPTMTVGEMAPLFKTAVEKMAAQKESNGPNTDQSLSDTDGQEESNLDGTTGAGNINGTVQDGQIENIPGGTSGVGNANSAEPNGEGQNGGRSGGNSNGNRTGTSSGTAGESGNATNEATGIGNNGISGRIKPLPADINARNHVIRDEDVIVPDGAVAKTIANMNAVVLLRTLEAEDRNATPEEKRILAKFVGWGGLATYLGGIETQMDDSVMKNIFTGEEQKSPYSWRPWTIAASEPIKTVGRSFEDVVKEVQKKYNQIAKENYGISNYLDKRTLSLDDARKYSIPYLINEDELQAAIKSTENAHYTDRSIISPLWDLLRELGFNGGNFLESSAGIGHFIGLMPEDLQNRSNISAVELDSLSGRILKKLYPDANIQIKGFEDTNFPNNSFDVVMSNVPFASTGRVADAKNKDIEGFALHNYMIAKNLKQLKPGGLAVMITSRSTMDNQSSLAARRWFTKTNGGNSELVGAIRLPNNAFDKNAATQVTTDIMIFQKRKDSIVRDVNPFIHTNTIREEIIDEELAEISINEYYTAHPENMIGEMKFAFEVGSGGLYSKVDPTLHAKPGTDIAARVKEIIATLPKDILNTEYAEFEVGVSTTEKEGKLFIKDRKVYVSNGDSAFEPTLMSAPQKKIALDYVPVRDAISALVAKEGLTSTTNEELEKDRAELNTKYDAFVKKHGTFTKNSFLYDSDIDYSIAAAVENVSKKVDFDPNGKVKKTVTVNKSDIFSRRVNFPRTEPSTAASLDDAIQISLAYRNHVNAEYIGRMLGMSEDEAGEKMLEDKLVFKNPVNGLFEIPEEYLSGNVRVKMEDALAAANEDAIYDRNVAELRKVIPQDRPASTIPFKMGVSWIPANVYQEFILQTLGVGVNISYVPESGNWYMDPAMQGLNNSNNTDTYGVTGESERASGIEIVSDIMNNRTTTLNIIERTADGVKTTRKDEVATSSAQDMQNRIIDEFRNFVVGSEVYGPQMEKEFNKRFNNLVERKFRLPLYKHFPGAVTTINLRVHQIKSVLRGLSENILLAHSVGTGKTFTMITLAMEMRRLGVAKKPMIAVQNATLKDFAEKFHKLYPGAKLLVSSEQDKGAEERRRFYARIASGDWDAVIIPQSQLDMIPDNPERVANFLKEKIEEMKSILESGNMERYLQQRIQKEIEAYESEIDDIYLSKDEKKMILDGDEVTMDENGNYVRKNPLKKGEKKGGKSKVKKEAAKLAVLTARIKKQATRRTDNVLNFEQMNVDAIFVDEAHEYKKLGFQTGLTKIKGIDTKASKKALSVYMKTQAVMDKTGGKNVLFATGTPITNTMAEAWTMMRYLSPDMIKDMGIQFFDQFANTFTEVEPSLEQNAGGKFEVVSRMKSFKNVPELQAAFKKTADVVVPEDIPEFKSDPDNAPPVLRTGSIQAVFVPLSGELKRTMHTLADTYQWWKDLRGKEKKELSYLPLVLYGIAKKASIDPRLLDPSAPDDPLSKVNATVAKVIADYHEYDQYKGTQMVFSDTFQNSDSRIVRQVLGVRNDGKKFNLYSDIKAKLVAAGIPANEIAILSNIKNDDQKKALFDKMNSGVVRIALGSTQKMGIGVNAHERMISLHHIDAPDRPDQFTQRNGRIIRPGNMFTRLGIPVNVYAYGVEGTRDATSYGRLHAKESFVVQFMKGVLPEGVYEMEDAAAEDEVDTQSFFSEVSANLSGSQYAIELVFAEKDLRTERNRATAFQQRQTDTATRLRSKENYLPKLRKEIVDADAALKIKQAAFPDNKITSIEVKGEVITENITDRLTAFMEAIDKAHDDSVERAKGDANKAGFKSEDFVSPSSLSLKFKINGVDAKYTKNMFNAEIQMDALQMDKFTSSATSLLSLVRNWVKDLDDRPQRFRDELSAEEKNIATLKENMKNTYDFDKVEVLQSRVSELKALLLAESEAQTLAEKAENQEKGLETPKINLKAEDLQQDDNETPNEDQDGGDNNDDNPDEPSPKRSPGDKLRRFKIPRSASALSTIVPGAPQIWNAAVEIVAKALDAGYALADALRRGSDYIKMTYGKPWDISRYNTEMVDQLKVEGYMQYNITPAQQNEADKVIRRVRKGANFITEVDKIKEVFEKAILAASTPAAAKVLQDSHDEFEKYLFDRLALDQIEKTTKQIDLGLKEQTRLQKVKENFQNRYERAARTQAAMEAQGITIDEKNDMMNAADRWKSVAVAVNDDVLKEIGLASTDIFIWKGQKKVKDSFFDRMQKTGIEDFYRKLGLYMYAKHAPERNIHNRNLRRNALDIKILQLEADLAEAEIKYAATPDPATKARVTNVKAELKLHTDYQAAYGDPTQNPNYIKLLEAKIGSDLRLMDDGGSGMTNDQAQEIIDEVDKGGNTSVFDEFADEFSEKVVGKILEKQITYGLITDEEYQFLSTYYQNYVPLKVDQKYFDDGISFASQKTPGAKIFRSKGANYITFENRINPLSQAIVDLQAVIFEGEKNNYKRTVARAVESAPDAKVWELQSPRYKAVKDRSGRILKLEEIDKPNPKSVIPFIDHGAVKKYIVINDEALRKELTEENVVGALPILSKVNSFFRAINTIYNPNFTVSNLIRDMETAGVVLSAGDKKELGKNFGKNLPKILSMIRGSYREQSGKTDSYWTKVAREYKDLGGNMTWFHQDTIDNQIKDIEAGYEKYNKSGLFEDGKNVALSVSDFINKANQAVETSTRISIFDAAKKAGMTPEKAVELARNATVNFNKKGNYSAVADSLYLFANASIQGSANVMKSMLTTKKGRYMAGGIVLLGMMQSFMNNAFSDCDIPENCYDNIPSYEKDKYMIIRTVGGKGFIKIPLAYGFNSFFNLGENIAQLMQGKVGIAKATANAGSGFLNAFNPLGGTDTPLLQQMSFTVTDPIVQWQTNRDGLGRKIYNDSGFDKGPDSQKAFTSDSPGAVAFADWLNRTSGGNEKIKGKIDVTPGTFDWAYETATGGLGVFIKQVSTVVAPAASAAINADANKLKGYKDIEFKRIPILNRFYTIPHESADRGKIYDIQNRSYNEILNKEDIDSFNQETDKAVRLKKLDSEKAQKYKNTVTKNQFELTNPDFIKSIDATAERLLDEDELEGLRESIDAMVENGQIPKNWGKGYKAEISAKQNLLKKKLNGEEDEEE